MLVVDDLVKTYGTGPDALDVIRGMSFTIGDGEFTCLVGPSGAGKTTLLRCVCGLLAPTSGQVRLDDAVVTEPPPGVSVVFQEYGRSLLPWMTVRQNVELPLKEQKLTAAERRSRVDAAVEDVGLSPFLDRYPWQLSGGMQQRVAIARGLAVQPRLLLMDEPFASVDAQTRADLEDLMLTVRTHYEMTVVVVTHDIDEAVYLGDRVLVLTGRPSHVLEDLRVDLPAPRDQIGTKQLPEFGRLRARVFADIRSASAPRDAGPVAAGLSAGPGTP